MEYRNSYYKHTHIAHVVALALQYSHGAFQLLFSFIRQLYFPDSNLRR